jgi:hypothetical protein
MNLSPHFTLAELTRSEAATRGGFSNTPDAKATAALAALCNNVLEPLRVKLGKPIRINSGYRGPEANKAVSGSPTSQHCCKNGDAATDIEVDGMANLALAKLIIDLDLPFDQLILEFFSPTDPSAGWVHASHKAAGPNRREVLTAMKVDGKTVYSKGLPA